MLLQSCSGGISFLQRHTGSKTSLALQRPAAAPSRAGSVVAHALKGFGLPSVTKLKKEKCPCNSGNSYADCCQKLHKVQQMKVSSPEQLLRARFSAYVKKDWKYVLRTTHSNNPAKQGSTSADGAIKTTYEQDVKVTMRWADMSNLTVLKVKPGATPDEAEIDFQYNMKQLYELQTGEPINSPETKMIRETAVFQLEEGEWRALSSRNNWDRDNLQMVAEGSAGASS